MFSWNLKPRRLVVAFIPLLLVVSACSSSVDDDGPLRIYTSVTQATVDAVVEEFQALNPEVEVEVFRAPTGELTARVAAELREGEVQADIFWLTDPLSIQQYDADGLLRSWEPAGIEALPEVYVEDAFFGTRILNMIIVAASDIDDPPSDWSDLDSVGSVAIPDPGFAGSAFAALAHFALDDQYGIDFYRDLHTAGAVQVNAPGDVVTGVAEGVYQAGMTLDFTANEALSDGSPIQVIWPASGAIPIYSPIAVLESSALSAAEDFVEFVISPEGQTAIAQTGWQPVREDVPWEVGGAQVTVDWALAFDNQEALLDQYRSIFGGN